MGFSSRLQTAMPSHLVRAPKRIDPILAAGRRCPAICSAGHSTPDAKGVPDVANKTGGGGMPLHGPWGISYAPNITPNGIGKWTDAQIKTAITKGVRPDGIKLKPPMGFHYYKGINRADLDALVAYLRTLKPL
jgi:hypothetical protein